MTANENHSDMKSAKDAVAKCNWAKLLYERCFNRWYRFQFLRGNMYRECDEYFDEYKACLMEEFHKIGLANIDQFDDPDFGQMKLPKAPTMS